MFGIETKTKLVLNNKTDFKNIYENYLYTRTKLTEDLVRHTTSFHKTGKRGGTKRFKGTKGTKKRRTKHKK